MQGLEVRGLVKRLGDQLAVDGVSFTVDAEQFLALLGPSGCGKTTTLRMICGLETPDAGEILVNGRPVTRLPSRERNLGMVFQEYGLYPSMDVFGNMAYGLQARGGLPRREIEARVREAAGKLGLSDMLRKPITDLSGGEQQRVALGRAMVKDADAYLFDEPLSNLDPKLRHQARRDIMALHRTKARPTVYVTHDQSEAFAMGDVVAVMSAGRLVQAGTPTTLVEEPANTFVAGFVGSPPMNLLPARLQAADGAVAAVVGDDAIPVPPGWQSSLADYDKREIVLGIRPEGFSLPAADGAAPLTGKVTDVEPLIDQTVVRMQTAEGRSLAAVFRRGEEQGVTPGEVLRVGVRGEQLWLFDADTEEALRR